MTDTQNDAPAVDFSRVRQLVTQAVEAAVPPHQMTARKIREESEYSWPTPQPRAGLQAALAVANIAQKQAYRFAKDLRAEGTSWPQIADLLGIPWSADYIQQERAFELVAGPVSSGGYSNLVYWICGGYHGCGQYITDHGPYDGSPANTEDGHADGCRRQATETEAYNRASLEREKRDQVMDKAMDKLTDPFGRETVSRARYVQTHGGRYRAWSTSEALAVALALRDAEELKRHGFSTQKAALDRVISGMGSDRPANPQSWLRLVRAAATGTF